MRGNRHQINLKGLQNEGEPAFNGTEKAEMLESLTMEGKIRRQQV